ncbi:hypothetical protein B0T19DRAFT_445299 [Cercophora scortea]|uniref:Uncharacterized protein n=1 Tax=Cercophora scortea TaxID=314031 RepID=A0AAE0M505_9PEZI|nr:hypothetical protein B0T19DRAFT_445299 [Cercophora scortea]
MASASQNTRDLTLQYLIEQNDAALFTTACASDARPPSIGFFTWLKFHLINQDQDADIKFADIQDGLMILANLLPELHLGLEVANSLNLMNDDCPEGALIWRWATSFLSRVINDENKLRTYGDGIALFDATLIYFEADFLHSRIIPFVIHTLTKPAPAVLSWVPGFLSRIAEKAFSRLFQPGQGRNIYGLIATTFLTSRIFTTYGFTVVEVGCDKDPRSLNRTSDPSLTPPQFAQLINDIVNLELYPALTSLTNEIEVQMELASDLRKYPPFDFRDFWLPSLRLLEQTLFIGRAPPAGYLSPLYRRLFGAVLRTYAWNRVGMRPNYGAHHPAQLDAYHAWLERREEFSYELSKFHPAKLWELLGRTWYHELVEMSFLNGDSPPPPPSTLQPSRPFIPVPTGPSAPPAATPRASNANANANANANIDLAMDSPSPGYTVYPTNTDDTGARDEFEFDMSSDDGLSLSPAPVTNQANNMNNNNAPSFSQETTPHPSTIPATQYQQQQQQEPQHQQGQVFGPRYYQTRQTFPSPPPQARGPSSSSSSEEP